MEKDVFKVSTGAIRADEHYLATGHKINHSISRETVGMNFTDYKSKYQCEKCKFTSYGGKRTSHF